LSNSGSVKVMLRFDAQQSIWSSISDDGLNVLNLLRKYIALS